jgi:general secretion pathway protein L
VTLEQAARSSLTASHRFLHWWLDELFGCLPKALDFRSRWTRGEWVVLGAPYELLLGRDHGLAGFETVERLGIRDGRIALASAQAARLTMLDSHIPLTLRLPSEWALRRTIRLPVAALENLREAVAFQLDRYTPFTHDHAYFEYAVIQRDDLAGQLVIEATVIAREIVTSQCTMLKHIGLDVNAVEIAQDDSAAKSSTRLIVPELRQRPRAQHVVNFAVATALVLFVGTAIFLPLEHMNNEERGLATQLEAARRQNAAISHLEAENVALRREGTFLADHAGHPTALGILLELSKFTPDDAWIESLQYTGKEVTLSGLSTSASTLIGRLAQSNLIHNLEFRAPVTPDPRLGRERFQISGQLQADVGQTSTAPSPAKTP